MHLYGDKLHIIAFTLFIGIIAQDSVIALRDVYVQVPPAVKLGERALLKCFYDIEDDSLYSVKWYRGLQEFYRYMPKETPAMKVFQIGSLRVDRYASNESQVILESVTLSASARYSCEVSADAPSFHTLIATAELEVVEIPHSSPLISGLRPRYRVGDTLRGNCTSRYSRPAANLTWTLNNHEVHPSHVRHHKILKDVRNAMETSFIGVHFIINPRHFESGALKLRCTAQLYDIYRKYTERTILEDHQKHAPSDHTIKTLQNEPLDQYLLSSGELLLKKDTYFTQIQDFLFHFVPTSDATSVNTNAASSALLSPRATYASTTIRTLLLLLAALLVKELLLLLPWPMALPMFVQMHDGTSNQNAANGQQKTLLRERKSGTSIEITVPTIETGHLNVGVGVGGCGCSSDAALTSTKSQTCW